LLGPFVSPLPNQEQQFLALSIDSGGEAASMSLLGDDENSVFSFAGGSLRPDFRYQFTGGIVSSDSIRFRSPQPSPNPSEDSYDYVIRFTNEGLSLQGNAWAPCVFCSDFPEDLSHTNVTAIFAAHIPLIEEVRRDGDDLKFTFKGDPGHDYFVEFTASLPVTQWLQLTNFWSKLQAIQPQVIDAVTNAQMRIYRVRMEPCRCR
jgi:hypothetical protein